MADSVKHVDKLRQSPLFADRQLVDLASLKKTNLVGPRLAIIDNFQTLNRIQRLFRIGFFSIRLHWVRRQLDQQHGFKIVRQAAAIPDLERPTFFVELQSPALRYYQEHLCQQDNGWIAGIIKKIIQFHSRIPIEAGAVIIFAEKKNDCD